MYILTSDPAPIKTKKTLRKKTRKEAKTVKKDQEEGKERSDSKAGVNGPVEGTPTPQEVHVYDQFTCHDAVPPNEPIFPPVFLCYWHQLLRLSVSR